MPNRRNTFVVASFLAIAFLSGIAGALQRPTLSLFLTSEVRAAPMLVGLFYAVTAISGIGVGFLLGGASDKHGDRRTLVLFCFIMAMVNSLLFAFNRHYLLLLGAVILLASIANAAIPQLFALAREYTDNASARATSFSTLMRAQMSLAWVLGPPLAFWLALNHGFVTLYLCAAGVFFICALFIRLFLPPAPRARPVDVLPIHCPGLFANKEIRLLSGATMLLWTCNSMYSIDMPLFIHQELGLPQELSGILMAAAAGMEIPFILLAGHLVKYFGKRRLMLFAALSGFIFHLGLVLFPCKTALIVLQFFNALFVAIVAGIGITYFQDNMPNRAGAASTLFVNCLASGIILAGLIQGCIVEIFDHHAVYRATSALAVIAFIMMYHVKDA